MSEFSLSPSPFAENGNLRSVSPFSPLSISSRLQFHNPFINNSTSVTPFSENMFPTGTPVNDCLKSSFALGITPYENSLNLTPFNPSPFNLMRSPTPMIPSTPVTELPKIPPFNPNICLSTQQLDRSDLKLLRNMLEEKNEPPKKIGVKKQIYKKLKSKNKPHNPLQSCKRKAKPFSCKCCRMCFSKAQALGGHMSRSHPGESKDYQKKKVIRKDRKLERVKLIIAKKRFFASLGHDYDDMMLTPEGRLRIKVKLNRTQIKKLKKTITEQELNDFIDEKGIEDDSIFE